MYEYSIEHWTKSSIKWPLKSIIPGFFNARQVYNLFSRQLFQISHFTKGIVGVELLKLKIKLIVQGTWKNIQVVPVS